MAARVSEEDEQQRTVVEMAQQAYLPKKVNYYVKGSERSLEVLAQSFGVNQKDLCRWNRMHLNDVLTPGTCLVFYKRGFEVEPVHLARSVQPDAVADSPAIQLASAGFSGTQGSVVAPVRHSYSAGKSSLASSYTYTVHRGDTLEKVARRAGMNVQSLCALNGLKPRAEVRPGQRIKLVNAQSGSAKSVHTVSFPDSKTSSNFVPAVYAAEKHDTLSKIARQRGIDLEGLCQINGLSKNTALKPGQKIKLLEQDNSAKDTVSVAVTNASLHATSKQTQAAANTLQANMKPTKEIKSKGNSTLKQQSSAVQKTSKKTSSAGTSAQLTKAEKKPKNKSKN
jgi:LysM repeat protein